MICLLPRPTTMTPYAGTLGVMQEREAFELAGQWAEAQPGPRAQPAYEATGRLATALSIVPDRLQWGRGVGEGPLQPLVLLGGRRFSVDVGDRDHIGVTIDYVSLTPSACRLSVSQLWGQDASVGVQQGFWLRTYHLPTGLPSRRGAVRVEGRGREIVQGRFVGESGLDQQEMFGRALVAALRGEPGDAA